MNSEVVLHWFCGSYPFLPIPTPFVPEHITTLIQPILVCPEPVSLFPRLQWVWEMFVELGTVIILLLYLCLSLCLFLNIYNRWSFTIVLRATAITYVNIHIDMYHKAQCSLLKTKITVVVTIKHLNTTAPSTVRSKDFAHCSQACYRWTTATVQYSP